LFNKEFATSLYPYPHLHIWAMEWRYLGGETRPLSFTSIGCYDAVLIEWMWCDEQTFSSLHLPHPRSIQSPMPVALWQLGSSKQPTIGTWLMAVGGGNEPFSRPFCLWLWPSMGKRKEMGTRRRQQLPLPLTPYPFSLLLTNQYRKRWMWVREEEVALKICGLFLFEHPLIQLAATFLIPHLPTEGRTHLIFVHKNIN
jgi:hypothetical protein